MIKNYAISQFGRPHGWAGRLVGWVMARGNLERNLWAVARLDVQPEDHLLELGFGPGLAIQAAAARATRGRVAGVDHSALMRSQAANRNHAAVREGRVELRLGVAEALPYADGEFHKAYAVNSFRHWREPAAGLQEMHRVLRPGGLAAIFEQPRSAQTSRDLEEVRWEIETGLQRAGFRALRFETRHLKPVPCLAILGIK